MDYSIKKRLNQNITIHPFISRDGAADASYGTPIVLKGFAYGYVRTVRNLKGEEVVSKKTIYLTQEVSKDDLVEIDNGKFPIIDFQIWPEENGESGLVGVLL